MQRTAKDGTVFRVFDGANGNYVAVEDDNGSHHAPSQYASLSWWSEGQARRALKDAVDEYERDIDEGAA